MSNLDVTINGTRIHTGPNCPKWIEDMWIEIAKEHGDKPAPSDPEEIRFHQHQVILTNQDIIEMAYAHRDLIAPLIEGHNHLFF